MRSNSSGTGISMEYGSLELNPEKSADPRFDEVSCGRPLSVASSGAEARALGAGHVNGRMFARPMLVPSNTVSRRKQL